MFDFWLSVHEKDQYLILSLACYQQNVLHHLPGASESNWLRYGGFPNCKIHRVSCPH